MMELLFKSRLRLSVLVPSEKGGERLTWIDVAYTRKVTKIQDAGNYPEISQIAVDMVDNVDMVDLLDMVDVCRF
jgi:hypothetical protein